MFWVGVNNILLFVATAPFRNRPFSLIKQGNVPLNSKMHIFIQLELAQVNQGTDNTGALGDPSA